MAVAICTLSRGMSALLATRHAEWQSAITPCEAICYMNSKQ